VPTDRSTKAGPANGSDSGRNASAPAPAALPRREAPSEQITRHLLGFLLSGDLAPGQKIPSERSLAESLEVGRGALREAIKSLSLLGLLDVRQGDGTYLTGSASDLLPRVIDWGLLIGERTVADLVEARTIVEISAAGLAAERAGEKAVKRLTERYEAMRAATDAVAYGEAEAAFHLEIASASRNEVLANLVASLQSLLGVWAKRVLADAGEAESSLAMHEPIMEAIEQGSAEAARAAMEAYMDRANRRLAEALAQAAL
jgi:GntR family transcriptional repressor for pyruvate dehydrogenase complex